MIHRDLLYCKRSEHALERPPERLREVSLSLCHWRVSYNGWKVIMYESIETFRAFARQKRVAVIGVGISNRPLIVWLSRLGVKVEAFDRLEANDPYIEKSKAWLLEQGVEPIFHLGDDYLEALHDFDLIFRTPRMQPDEPALLHARKEGAIITSEMELFLTLCKAPVIAVTGSDGKTTTTSLIAEMLKAEGYFTYVGGNIGTPLLDQVQAIGEEDRVVVELSSFQLVSMHQRIETAVITNITPNHLDVHPTFEDYVKAKKNIFLHQTLFDRLILNAKDPESMKCLVEAVGTVDLFNQKERWPSRRVYRENDRLYVAEKDTTVELLNVSEILLPGAFNVENMMTAALAVWPDVGIQSIQKVARQFKGVPHRMELVREHQDVRWYNSSIDSTPHRSSVTLGVFAENHMPLILIAGGADKKSDYRGLGEAILEATTRIILCGENAPHIRQALKDEAKGRAYTVVDTTSYEEAVQTAHRMAKPGDHVLLSPTGTSFDQFRHFEERGEYFKALVNRL